MRSIYQKKKSTNEKYPIKVITKNANKLIKDIYCIYTYNNLYIEDKVIEYNYLIIHINFDRVQDILESPTCLIINYGHQKYYVTSLIITNPPNDHPRPTQKRKGGKKSPLNKMFIFSRMSCITHQSYLMLAS